MKRIIIFIIFLSNLVMALEKIPEETNQLLVALTPDWQSFKGRLYILNLENNVWKISNPKGYKITIGRNGMAWGRGLHEIFDKINIKKEGDGKSPAGIFNITKKLYGYEDKPPFEINFPYVKLKKELIAVDDPKSKYYNKIINVKKIKDKDWNSYEDLKRKDELYKWVLLIEHNTKNIVPYGGSCIFFHLWRSENNPTSGCTATSEENLLEIIKNLKNSILIQLPNHLYEDYRKKFNLPNIIFEKD